MFCRQCGSQIPDGSKFCPKCGAKVIPVQKDQANSGEYNEQSDRKENEKYNEQPDRKENEKSNEQPSESKSTGIKNLPKFLIPVVVVAAVVVIVIIAFGTRASNRIDMTKYVDVEFYGYDGNGSASVDFDWEALGDKYDKKVKLNNGWWGWMYDSFSDLLDDCTYIYVEPNSGLSNGDSVTVSFEVDTDDLNDMINKNIKISAKPKTYKVSGLGEVETFDAFEGVSVEFSGTSPKATASIINNSSTDGLLDYRLSQTDELAIGDTVIVSIDEESANYYMQENGMYPAEMQKEFAVENINYYVSSLDEIPADGMDKLKSQSEDVFMAGASSWDEHAQLDSIEYLGSYFLYEKPGVYNYDVNIIYMVYGVHARQYGKTESGTQTETNNDYYWYIGFYNGMVLADGTFTIDYSDYSVPSHNVYGAGIGFNVVTYDYTVKYAYDEDITLSYAGYENLDSMFNNLVTSEIDEYTYESTVSGTPSGNSASSGSSETTETGDSVETEEPEETEESEQVGEVSTGDYLCSYSSDRLITDADLAAIRASDYGSLPSGRSLEQMIVNEIYAKHGYLFSTSEIQAYFDQKDWYNDIGTYQTDMEIVAGQFSSIEKQNVDFLESK